MESEKQDVDRIKIRLIAIFLVIFLLAISIVSISLNATRNVSDRTQQLISTDIPELKAISTLQSAKNQTVIDLYLYYATLEPAAESGQEKRKQTFENALAILKGNSLDAMEVSVFLRQVASFDEKLQRFDAEMKKGSVRDWDLLRDHLAAAQIEANQIDQTLQNWGELIRWHATQAGELTQEEITRLHRFQLAFSLGVLGIAAIAMATLFARRKDQKELVKRAYYDQLTELPNRRSLQKYWHEKFVDSLDVTPYSVLLVSLDRFQLFTGTFGYLVGDGLLQSASGRLAGILNASAESTVLFHFLPASWVIIVKENESRTAGIDLAESLLNLSATPMKLGDRELSASCSIGIVNYPDHGVTLDSILKHADSALREAMLNGGADSRVYCEQMSHEAERSLSVENDLRLALESTGLELYYQPKISADNQTIIASEALIRWRKNDELIPPDQFIPIAEQTTLIILVGEWVIKEACRQWKAWNANGFHCLPVAVNISAQQFHLADFPAFVKQVLAETGMPAQMLELEITEEAATGNIEQVISTMDALKTIGVTLAIDDFGTGYSSLSYLKRFPLDILKIDRSFVWQMEESQGSYAIVDMIVVLAHDLGFKVVAEGVETKTQLQSLTDLGCDYMQGFHFSRPLPASEYSLLLAHEIDAENAMQSSQAAMET